jgi:hypothetical protein
MLSAEPLCFSPAQILTQHSAWTLTKPSEEALSEGLSQRRPGYGRTCRCHHGV